MNFALPIRSARPRNTIRSANSAIFSDLLIPKDFNSRGINTSKIFTNLRILLILQGFNPTRINTFKNKDLKPRRINTSGGNNILG
jgi:hypothetical protein